MVKVDSVKEYRDKLT